MGTKSKKLDRQIRKTFGAEDFESTLQALIGVLEAKQEGQNQKENLKEDLKVLTELPRFLELVDESYSHYEERVEIANRNLELSLKELTDLNLTITAMINSLGQGFLMFGSDGICKSTYSKSCEFLLQTMPAGKHLREVLRISEQERENFDGWIDLLFQSDLAMPFETIMEFGPKFYKHTEGRHVTLEYTPVFSSLGQRTAIVLVATDKTDEFEAKKDAAGRESFAEMIIRITKNRESFLQLVRSIRLLIFDLKADEGIPLTELKRTLHTLKGGVASFSIEVMASFFHSAESSLAEIPPEDTQRIKDFCKGLSAKLEKELDSFLSGRKDVLGDDFEKVGQVKKIPADILYSFAQEVLRLPEGSGLAMKFLKEVVATRIFLRLLQFETDVRTLAAKMGKSIGKFQVIGDDIRVLEEIYQDIFDSLVHVFRNIVDHGIETPSERIERGKQPAGQVVISINHNKESDTIEIKIEDDGAGIDLVALKEKIVEKFPHLSDMDMSDEEALQHLFDEGFSTKSRVTELSGRGIGLNAVRSSVEALGGRVNIRTRTGHGTTLCMVIPYVWDLPKSLKRAS